MTNRMQNKERQIIFFFCYRILEFRILFSTGLLNKLIEDVNLVIFVPPRTVTEVSKIVPDNVFVEPILYCQPLQNPVTNLCKKKYLPTLWIPENPNRNVFATTARNKPTGKSRYKCYDAFR